MRERIRGWFPPNGRRYELFDTSIYLAWIAFFGYVVFSLPVYVAPGLGTPLHQVSETYLGGFLFLTSVAGAAIAKWGTERWLDVGYALPRIAAWFMALNFAVTLLILGADCLGDATGWWSLLDDHAPLQQTARAAVLYVMIFGWAARRLARDNSAWWER